MLNGVLQRLNVDGSVSPLDLSMFRFSENQSFGVESARRERLKALHQRWCSGFSRFPRSACPVIGRSGSN